MSGRWTCGEDERVPAVALNRDILPIRRALGFREVFLIPPNDVWYPQHFVALQIEAEEVLFPLRSETEPKPASDDDLTTLATIESSLEGKAFALDPLHQLVLNSVGLKQADVRVSRGYNERPARGVELEG